METKKAIQELDKVLSKKKFKYVLYICGGAQLIFLGYTTRKTQDVDLILDEIDDNLKQAAQIVAKKLDLEEDWLNNKVFPLAKRLGRGWKNKTIPLFNGKALTLMGLNRQDLINSKLHAVIDRRGEDYQDLLFLKPTLKELAKAEKYVLILKKDLKTARIFLMQWIKEIKNDLGLN